MNGNNNGRQPPPRITAAPRQQTRPAAGGGGWRVEAGRLLIQSGADLPDICIYGGTEGEPGQRIAMVLPLKKKDPHPLDDREEVVRVMAFQSAKRAKALRWLRRVLLFGAPAVVAPIAWAISHTSRDTISAAGGVFLVLAVYDQNRGLSVSPVVDGWFHLIGVHSAAIARLKRIQESAEPR